MKKPLLLFAAAALLIPTVASSVTRYQTASSTTTNVSIQLADPAGSVYVEDEPIRMLVRTDSEAYVAVFNIDTDGFVHLLYPADNGSFRRMRATRQLEIPERSDETFLVTGSTGLEMIFAVAVNNKDDLDELEVSFLMNNSKLPRESQYRVDGDPFMAANDIASRLVRGISNRPEVSLAYTYFYVNQAVDFPRYLCTDCYQNGTDPYAPGMRTYSPTVAFDASAGLQYPLQAGFAQDTPVAQSPQPGVTYTYDTPVRETHVYVHYPTTRYVYYPSSWWYWDYYYWRPYCAGWYPYYPAPYRGWYFSVGWNWGYWGGGYYYPYHYGHDYYVDNRPVRGTVRPTRYKGGGDLYDDLHRKQRERKVAYKHQDDGPSIQSRPTRPTVTKGGTTTGGPIAQQRPPTTIRTKGGDTSGGPIAQQRPPTAIRTKGGNTNGGPIAQQRPPTAIRTKGGNTNGGPIAQQRPPTATRTKGGSDRPVAQLRPRGGGSTKTKGGTGGPIIQPGFSGGGGGGDVNVHRGKTTRTVKPLTRGTRGSYNPPSSKNRTRPSVQSRGNRTNRKSTGTRPSIQNRSSNQSKYRSSPKKSSSSYRSPTRSSTKSRSYSKPSTRSRSTSKVRSAPTRSSSRPSGRSSSRSSGSRGRGKSR